ncbi:glycoside hydrolase [Epithele typhae]|uniref:glycoside hydrolase n=1 Tax=Epithele typhae TaxID=378194 RepID=UPI002008EB8C|nr:glycoside hydrolase [Epithele typhae]KAH9925883.1 glycoside hydrolase [Epithele typhae]
MEQPRPGYLAPVSSSLDSRSSASTPADSSPFLNPATKEVYNTYAASSAEPARPLLRRPLVWLAAGATIAAIALAVVLPVYFVVIKPHDSTSSSSSGPNSSSDNGASGNNSNPDSSSNPTRAITTGGDGSTVTKEDGTTFTYVNPFGGYWVSDPKNPFNNSAKANSWTPALSETWKWGEDRIWGVNLGGLFVLEPFIVPALYEQHVGAVDEWTLSQLLGDSLNATLTNHYETFITEEDIAQIAGAGLNWIRLPIPFWAIEAWDNVGADPTTGQTVAEPFLAKVCWQYILRVLGWARKYGIRVNLDLHTAPGSQNGYNHSGKIGAINWMKSVMGLANAERTLDYIRIITEFISQPEWRDVVPMFGMLNEPYLNKVGTQEVETFYLKAYETIRGITGTGAGNGPLIAMHDGFAGTSSWAGFLAGADRLALDTHPYFAFNGNANRQPVNVSATGNSAIMGGQWPLQACNAWGSGMNTSRSAFGITVAGEFSNAFNDCGLFVRGITSTGAGNPAMYGDGCDYWSNTANWSDADKAGVKAFALASMDALGDYFFWTWKIGNSSASGNVAAPLWSYQLGLQQGFMPTDPREAVGVCGSLSGADSNPFDGNYAAAATGGSGAGTITYNTASLAWPPAQFTDVAAADMTRIPQYTPTGTVATLTAPTFYPSATVSLGDGWADAQDTVGGITPISGCAYPFAWDAESATIPAAGCTPAP